MAKALTQMAIENLKPGSARREIPDGKETGLYFVLQPTGKASWALRYRFNGLPRKLTLGPYPAISLVKARAEAIKAKSALASGNDPATDKQAAKAAARAATRQTSDAVEKVIGDFINLYAKPSTRAWKETERLLAEFGTAWKGRSLAEVDKVDIHRVLDGVVTRGSPVTANRKFAQLRKMCKWAVSRGIIERSPCEGVDAPSVEQSRDRVLSLDELRLVWSAADAIGYPFGTIVKLLVLSGQRRGEIGGMEWGELDLENRTWILPASRSKNRRQHAVPLSPQSIEIIKSLHRFSGSKFVFTSHGKKAASGYSQAKQRLDAIITKLNGEPIPAWVLHDLRRSFASGLAGLGINLPVIERVLNHVSGSFAGIVGVYQRHSFADEMREAMDRWGRRIESLIAGSETGNVVELARA